MLRLVHERVRADEREGLGSMFGRWGPFSARATYATLCLPCRKFFFFPYAVQ